MKTIAQFIHDGIATPSDLQDALQTAMQLEFATIPPYLCAEWSINTDTSRVVTGKIQLIVKQEMYHFALAGNMLSAIGRAPMIAVKDFIPTYPANILPGGIPQHLAVDLQPLSHEQLQVFMQIEYPEFPPVALRAGTPPTTIGEFYNTISDGFNTVKPTINPNAYFVTMGQAVFPIKTIEDAQKAIAQIKGEGEGTQAVDGEGTHASPYQPDGKTFAHYYMFKEIFLGKTLVQRSGGWVFDDPPITMPTVYNFTQSTATPSPSLEFNQTLSSLLQHLQDCWAKGEALKKSINIMNDMQEIGQDLIQRGVRPEFLWNPPPAGQPLLR